MNIADRIQNLRKTRGISQEELADKIGVSRQAVSKWESEQSTPDLEKVIIMSDFFGVTTDYILKGIEPVENRQQDGRELASRILYIVSAALIFIGLFCAFGGWYEKQTMEVVWGAMVVQAVGAAGYFIGKLLSGETASFYVKWLNVLGITFMPMSMITGALSIRIFGQGWIAPYPVWRFHTVVFVPVYLAAAVVSFLLLKILKRFYSKEIKKA